MRLGPQIGLLKGGNSLTTLKMKVIAMNIYRAEIFENMMTLLVATWMAAAAVGSVVASF